MIKERPELASYSRQNGLQYIIHSCWVIVIAFAISGCQSLFHKTIADKPKQQYLNLWLPISALAQHSHKQALASTSINESSITYDFPIKGSFTHVITTQNDKQPPLLIKGQIKPDKLVMVGLNDIGLPIFDIALQQQTFTFNQRVPITMPIPAEWLLESFQLMFWPLTTIEPHLAPHCIIKEVIKNQHVSKRVLRCDNQETIKIEYLFEKKRLSSVKYTPLRSPVEVQVDIIQ